MASLKDLDPQHPIQWCPGCGDFGILNAVKMAVVQAGWDPKDVVTVSGIGCSGKLPHYMKTYGFEGLHGRALPAATAIRFANHRLIVIAVGGDGDGYGIGMGHFIHSMRRNIDITYLVHNNTVYGLTTGQTSPTSEKGFRSKSTPHGAIEIPVNPLRLALSAGCTFVARGYAGDPKGLSQLIVKGVQHKGFSLIDVLQPCVTYDDVHTYEYYKQVVYNLADKGHDTSNFQAAYDRAGDWGKPTSIGLFFETKRPTYTEELKQLKDKPLVDQDISNIDISAIVKEFE